MERLLRRHTRGMAGSNCSVLNARVISKFNYSKCFLRKVERPYLRRQRPGSSQFTFNERCGKTAVPYAKVPICRRAGLDCRFQSERGSLRESKGFSDV